MKKNRESRFLLALVFTMVEILAVIPAFTAEWGYRPLEAPKWVIAAYVIEEKAIGLRWVTTPGATEYKILRSEVQGKEYSEIGISTIPLFFDREIEEGKSYFYVVAAASGIQVGTLTEERSVLVPSVDQIQRPLRPPRWVRIDVSRNIWDKVYYRVKLFWLPPPGPNSKDVIAYNVYRSGRSGEGYELIGSTPDTYYEHRSFDEGATYYYVLTAIDEAFKETAYSVEASAVITEK